MAVALADIFPNATHGEFVRAMQPALLDLARECRVVLEGVRAWLVSRHCFRVDGPAYLYIPMSTIIDRRATTSATASASGASGTGGAGGRGRPGPGIGGRRRATGACR